MTKEFSSLEKFSKHLIIKVDKQYDKNANFTLKFLGLELENSAKKKIGHLQEGGGQFKAWTELAESTKADKERQGYVFNSDFNPLYRTGTLRDSISFSVNKIRKTVYLGSTSEIMIYHELGTINMPPRSVLGLTMFKSKSFIMATFATMMINWISNNRMTFKKKAEQ